MVKRYFALFVAIRYLTARRKQTVISVITVISVLGVAAGVMALVVALAINTGFRQELQRNLLGATAHVIVMEKQPSAGIEDWRAVTATLAKTPHVTGAAPALYGPVMFTGPAQATGGTLKGILPATEAPLPEALKRLKSGAVNNWDPVRGYPPIIIGSRLAEHLGLGQGDIIRVISPQGELTPMGLKLVQHQFRIAGVFESGFFELDNSWAYAGLRDVQRVMGVRDVVNAVELNVDDVYRAAEIAADAEKQAGPKLGATHWMEQNKQLLTALRTERIVTVITIGLIQMVGVMNILISLVMAVIEKHRDIAIMLSLGVRRRQIGRIFMLQGVLIGVAGTVIGLAIGYTLCYFGDRGRWIRLDESVYSLSYVPFAPRLFDGLWISASALLVSFLATLYPARSATRIQPAEALRYE